MGNMCCCCKSKNDDFESEITLGPIKNNEAVSCKDGARSGKIKFAFNNEKKTYNVEGTGTAIGSCALDCDVAYFEVRIGSQNPAGTRVGLKRISKKQTDLSGFLDAEDSDNSSQAWFFNNNNLKEGDVVGVYWDQTDLPMLSFTLNGVTCDNASIPRVRPAIDIYPAVSVKDGNCEFIFHDEVFVHKPKSSKFRMIVCATNLI